MSANRALWYVIALIVVAGLIGVVTFTGRPPKPPSGDGNASPKLSFKTPTDQEILMSTETKECIGCHQTRGITASAIRDWKLSAHAYNETGCEMCHIPVDAAPVEIQNATSACEDKRVRRSVSATNCQPCHAQQVEQFTNGKHSKAWVAMTAMPMMPHVPEAIVDRGCGACHNIGRDTGRCDACHTRHEFSAAEARRPEACQTCHMGFDHPQWEMYSTSKHGSLYRMHGDNWDWHKKLGDWFEEPYEADASTPRTPTCAFCHMPSGDHTVKTAWGFLALRLAENDPEWQQYRNTIFKGLGVIDADGKPTERFQVVLAGDVARTNEEEWIKQRQREIDQCLQCHSRSFTEETFKQADQVIKEADALMAEAVEIVNGLYADGVLPPPKDRPPTVDLLEFYEVKNPIEQQLYVMFLEHRMRTYQGAFHMNPDYLHWYGWAEMRRDLAEIKKQAEELRAAHGEPATESNG